MTEKRLYIHRFGDAGEVQNRISLINDAIASSPLSAEVSFRCYTSKEDDSLLIEKWQFPSIEIEASFRESVSAILGAWPADYYADEIGPLMLRKNKDWQE